MKFVSERLENILGKGENAQVCAVKLNGVQFTDSKSWHNNKVVCLQTVRI